MDKSIIVLSIVIAVPLLLLLVFSVNDYFQDRKLRREMMKLAIAYFEDYSRKAKYDILLEKHKMK